MNLEEDQQMNIEKIKEFIALRKELRVNGVIGLSVWDDRVHVEAEKLVNVDVQVLKRNCLEFPYEISTKEEGITIFAVLTQEKLNQLFPQFTDYMEEDVDLTGGEEEVSA
jgi:hypothetical protein